MQEIEAFAVLNSIPCLGSIKIRLLLQTFGSALEALKASENQIKTLQGFSKVLPHWTKWEENQEWKKDIALADKQQVQMIPFTSPLFPKPLLKIADHPVLLYVKGQLKQQDQRSIAVVGTRHSSIYGNEMAEQISGGLAENAFTIISGLARGIDTAAHRGALKKGRTIAVIGSGLANIYPPENKALAEEISQKGALISEFCMAAKPDRQNFPQRNRIVSGMSLASLLIEAPIKSGAMITMEKALSQKRKLFALPGRADQENFRGNHHLIKNGNAFLIENAFDIISHFDELFLFSGPQKTTSSSAVFNQQEQTLLQMMGQVEIGIDALAQNTMLPVQQVHTILMGLVLKKAVKEFPGKLYKKSV